jgi:3-dehydroquinate synthase
LTVGGGAILDMAGFAAATTHRGVRNVRVPTRCNLFLTH